jgi:putative CocE/NonD family hydrolase
MRYYRHCGVEVELDVKVPMRDGVRLSVDIYRPQGAGPFPAILTRTPYDNASPEHKALGSDQAFFFAEHGYIHLLQDCRGRCDSEGEWYPHIHDAKDGHDTIEWIGRQPWCDGNVGMWGLSYMGLTQWDAATLCSPYLKCILPLVIGPNMHDSPWYSGGAFQLHCALPWRVICTGRTWQDLSHYNWPNLFTHLPLKDVDRLIGGEDTFYRDWIEHPSYDDYWKAFAIKEQCQNIKVPVFQISGWYDIFVGGTVENYVSMKERGGSPEARQYQKMLIGPWIHLVSESTQVGDVDFGADSQLDLRYIELRWFDYWLKGIDNGVVEEPPIKIFIMGTNVWREEQEWPLARTEFTPYYFHSQGSGNTFLGDGVLSPELPADEPEDRFTYDPDMPVPSQGGATCCWPDFVPWGPYCQLGVEQRDDVLCYTSDVLQGDLEVTGPVKVKLYASSDALDTDFTAKLVDVHPSGEAINLCDGIIRGRYRETLEVPVLMEPGEIYEFNIDLWATSNVFSRGHRVRVEISSSNFPRFDRNPNTGHDFGVDAEVQVAHQKVYHSSVYPSHIVLPVIPRD